MEQKLQFVTLAATGRFTFTELSADFHISRKTGQVRIIPTSGEDQTNDVES